MVANLAPPRSFGRLEGPIPACWSRLISSWRGRRCRHRRMLISPKGMARHFPARQCRIVMAGLDYGPISARPLPILPICGWTVRPRPSAPTGPSSRIFGTESKNVADLNPRRDRNRSAGTGNFRPSLFFFLHRIETGQRAMVEAGGKPFFVRNLVDGGVVESALSPVSRGYEIRG